jgi:hypothetical protein
VKGFHFTVVTDHSSLTWLHLLNSPASRLARWAFELPVYDFPVKYRKGTSNVVPNALSRLPQTGVNPQGEAISLLCPDNETGQGDLWNGTNFNRVQQRPDEFPDCRIVRNVLSHHRLDPLKESFVATRVLIKRTVTFHDYIFSLLMHEEVVKYVRSCPKCKAHKPENRPPTGLMVPREYHGPWHTVAVDTMGPSPKVRHQKSYSQTMELSLYTGRYRRRLRNKVSPFIGHLTTILRPTKQR